MRNTKGKAKTQTENMTNDNKTFSVKADFTTEIVTGTKGSKKFQSPMRSLYHFFYFWVTTLNLICCTFIIISPKPDGWKVRISCHNIKNKSSFGFFAKIRPVKNYYYLAAVNWSNPINGDRFHSKIFILFYLIWSYPFFSFPSKGTDGQTPTPKDRQTDNNTLHSGRIKITLD